MERKFITEDRMRFIIAGGRTFSDYPKLRMICDTVFREYEKSKIEIVSGTAIGADMMGETYAKARKFPVKQFPADWDKHGKSAGYKRNEQMAKYADGLIAFWNGRSKGTRHMIDLAKKHGLVYKVFYY